MCITRGLLSEDRAAHRRQRHAAEQLILINKRSCALVFVCHKPYSGFSEFYASHAVTIPKLLADSGKRYLKNDAKKRLRELLLLAIQRGSHSPLSWDEGWDTMARPVLRHRGVSTCGLQVSRSGRARKELDGNSRGVLVSHYRARGCESRDGYHVLS